MEKVGSNKERKVGDMENKEVVEKKLEKARVFGQQYSSLIENILGRNTDHFSSDTITDPDIKRLAEQSTFFKDEQRKRFLEKDLDARGLLLQAFGTKEQLLQDPTQYRLEEFSPGLYAVFVAPQLGHQLRRGAEAVAITVRDGVSFILLQDHGDGEFKQRYMQENVPHETHHLIWNAAQASETFPSKETDPDFRESFLVFQDELIARASTNGALGGYSHIKNLSPHSRTELETLHPGKAEKIIARVADLNEFLEGLSVVLDRSEAVTKRDLVQTIVQARTFDELELGLRKMKRLIEALPMEPERKNENIGWG